MNYVILTEICCAVGKQRIIVTTNNSKKELVRKKRERERDLRENGYQVKIKFSSNRSVQNFNLTSETDD